ncbi:hypothetical protein Thermus77420_16340 [Thermus thalpophilus]
MCALLDQVKVERSMRFRILSLAEIPERPWDGRPKEAPKPEYAPSPEGDLPRGEAPAGHGSGPGPSPADRHLAQKLEKERHARQALERKVQRLEQELQKARADEGRRAQEAAHHRKRAEAAEARVKALEEEVRKRAALEEEMARLREELAACREKLTALEKEKAALEGLRERAEAYARLEAFKGSLPEPFPVEAFTRVLFVDYGAMAATPEERVLALVELYRALLEGRDHPAFAHTNRGLLRQAPEGVVLLGLERLLLDLADSPLRRWLRTHAWQVEAALTREGLKSPREE